MDHLLEAIVLGIVQGLTEFLPVSSSGHLEIIKYLFGDKATPEQSLLMTIMLHLATACSTLLVFRKAVWEILATASTGSRESRSYILKILISMLPAILVGVLFEDLVAAMFSQQMVLVGMALIGTAILLFVADRMKATVGDVSYGRALWIGVAQAVAIIPGLSRSGATIAASLMLKVERQKAAEFSFLMVVPLIMGKMVRDIAVGDWGVHTNMGALSVGFLAAFVTGVVACTWMIALVKRAKLKYFGWYCILVGSLSLAIGMRIISYA